MFKFQAKRIRNAKHKKHSIVDVQLILSAFLYSCYWGMPTSVVTADIDVLELGSEFMRVVLEKYIITQYLQQTLLLRSPREQDKIRQHGGEVTLTVPVADLVTRLNAAFVSSHRDPQATFVALRFYDIGSGRRVYQKFPTPDYLRRFIIEYKNLECYSLHPGIEARYPYRWSVDATNAPETVDLTVSLANYPFSRGLVPWCEGQCRYVQHEREHPELLSDFRIP